MSDNEMIVALAGMAMTFGTLVLIVRAWASRHRSSPGTSIEPLMDRLIRIEQTLDAIAIEVERVSEAQRFATRLLAEREPAPLLGETRGARETR